MQKIILIFSALIAFFCVLFTNISYAKLDSIRIIELKEKISKENSDRVKLDYFLELSYLLLEEINSDAVVYARDAITIAKKIDLMDKEIESLLILSRYYHEVGDVEESTKNATRALDLNEKFKSNMRYAQIYLLIAENYRYSQAIDHAYHYYFLALQNAELTKNNEILTEIYNRIAVYYFENTKLSLKLRIDSIYHYLDKSLKLAEETHNIKWIIINYNTLGLFETHTIGNLLKGEEYFKIAEEIAVKNSKESLLPFIYYNLASLNIYHHNNEKGKQYIDLGYKILEKYYIKDLHQYYLNLISNYYKNIKQYDSAYLYLEKHQALYSKNVSLKTGFRANQALANLQSRNQMNEQTLKVKMQQMQMLVILLFALLFVFLTFIFYFRNKNNKLHNEALAAQNNAIKSINEELDKSNKIIKEQNKLLEESNSAKDRLFSIISHDLKNPIGALKELIQILAHNRDNLTNEEIDEILFELKTSSSNVLDLLLELLTWSNSQRGNIDYDPYQQDLYQLVYQNISILQALAKQKKIELINKVNQNTFAYFDANMVNTIIRNLINNAIKFTNLGGKIIIGADKSTNTENELIVYVQDDGVGIPPNKVETLFQTQSNYTTRGTSGEKGTGLGLLIVKDFVEKNNGRIWVESELNVGTTFYFTLKTTQE